MGFTPIDQEAPRQGFTPLNEGQPPKPRKPSDDLPETLQVLKWDTGVKIPKSLSAFLVGAGYGMTDVYRGVKQALGGQETDAALKEDERIVRALQQDPDVGTSALAGEVTGAIAEPVSLALPVGKGKSLVSLAKAGAAAGAASGALGYVGEGQTRLKNTAIGAATGGLAVPVVAKTVNAATRGAARVAGKTGPEKIPFRAPVRADKAIEAGVVPSPKGFTPLDDAAEAAPSGFTPLPEDGPKPFMPESMKIAAEADAVDIERNAKAAEKFVQDGFRKNATLSANSEAHPWYIERGYSAIEVSTTLKKASQGQTLAPKQQEIFDAWRESTERTAINAAKPFPAGNLKEGDSFTGIIDGKLDDFKVTKVDGAEIEVKDGVVKKLDVFDDVPVVGGVNTTKLYSNPLDPELFKGFSKTYQNYVGKPLRNAVMNNPGTSVSAATGGAIGFNEDEDAPLAERVSKAAGGALLGAIGAKSLGRIPTKSGNLAESASKLFVDNYGLPSEYVRIKKNLPTYRNSIASQFLDLTEEAAKLEPGQRKLLYNILEGEAPKTEDLAGLSDKARQKITEFGQRMVDYGMLDPETFNKNAATYIHRSYTSKMGDKPVFQGAGKKVKILGNELKPRGVFKEVPADDVKKWTDLGWEVFGNPRAGQQKLRWQLTKEQRQSLGEIEDAAFAMAETGRLMSNDIASFQFFDDVAKNIASPEPKDGWVQVLEGKVPKTKVNKFGNLEGQYVPPEVFEDLKRIELYKNIRNMPGIKEYRALNGWWKVSKTALNPTVHTNNVISNFALYDFADADYRNLAVAGKELATKGNLFKQAVEMGVFDSDFATNELRNFNRKWMEAYSQIGDVHKDPVREAIRIVKKVAQSTGGKMIDLYQAEDHIFRLGVFIDRMKKGAAPEEAALESKKWFIDYDINAPAINFLRETATPFISYTYRVVPILAETATMRPWKFAKWAALGWGLNTLGETYGGGDTPKERALMDERRKGTMYGLPGMSPQAIKLPTKESQYLDATRWVPGGDVFDVTERGKMIPFLPAPAQPSFGILGTAMQTGLGYDAFTKKKIPGLGISEAEDAKAKGGYLLKQMAPNFPGVPGAYSTEKIAKSLRGQETPMGDRLEPWQAVLQSVGVKVFPADIEKMKRRAQFQTKQDVEAITEKIRSAAIDMRNGKITQEEYRAQVKRWTDEVRARLEGLRKKTNPQDMAGR